VKYRHEHGTRNPIIEQEEKAILLSVDRALSSSTNAQTIGRNGEIPFLGFLNRYLPPTFKAVSGHFITPKGNISPQIDVMIVDSRYPVLAENQDGSVLAMLHSVIKTIELKTNLRSTDLIKISSDIEKIRTLMNEAADLQANTFSSPITAAFAYRTHNKLDTIEAYYKRYCNPDAFHFDLTILRISDKELLNQDVGCELHFEPNSEDDVASIKKDYAIPESAFKGNYMLTSRPSYTPLSDIYYTIVQMGYYILGERNFSFNEIGAHMNNYMSWSTVKWNEPYS
jgi:hypothetical protein